MTIDFGLEPDVPCGLDVPPDRAPLRFGLIAEKAGIHRVAAWNTEGLLAVIGDDCGTPLACSNPYRGKARELYVALDEGQSIEFALQPLPGEVTDEISFSVFPPDDDQIVRMPDMQNPLVTASGTWGVWIEASLTYRMLAWPWMLARVEFEDGSEPVDVPLTVVEPIGHGLMDVAGVVTPVAAERPGPGTPATLRLIDPRPDGSPAGSEVRSDPLRVILQEPGPTSWGPICAEGTWQCPSGSQCTGTVASVPYHPGSVRTCQWGL